MRCCSRFRRRRLQGPTMAGSLCATAPSLIELYIVFSFSDPTYEFPGYGAELMRSVLISIWRSPEFSQVGRVVTESGKFSDDSLRSRLKLSKCSTFVTFVSQSLKQHAEGQTGKSDMVWHFTTHVRHFTTQVLNSDFFSPAAFQLLAIISVLS